MARQRQFIIYSILLFVGVFQAVPSAQAATTVIINEVMVSNASANLETEFVNFSDWIELHNPTAVPLDISGYHLSDDPTNLSMWAIPAGTTIPAGGFLLIWADGEDTGLHTNFKLKGGGEVLTFSTAAGVPVPVDVLDYTLIEQLPDISYGRSPDGSDIWAYYDQPTPNSSNNASPAIASVAQRTAAPVPTVAGGFYPTGQSVEFAATTATIYYTLDGSIPTTAATLYTGAPIAVANTAVLRARAYESGQLVSPITTQTYFIDESFTLPVISISVNDDYFFDHNIGIYVPGVNYVPGDQWTGNYFESWARPIALEYYDTAGQKQFQFDGGVEIHGNLTRTLRQKGLHVMTGGQYGSDDVRYQLFPDKSRDRFESFILRASGGDQYATFFRDAMMQRLVTGQMDMDADKQAYQPAIVFLNGQYWGIHNIREKVDAGFIDQNHGYDETEIDFLEFRDTVIEGSNTAYRAMVNYIDSNDMNNPLHYDFVKSQMEVDQFMDYWLAEIYFANTDWPSNNIKFWRPQTGKWRWILFDTDSGFDLADADKYNLDTLTPTTTLPSTGSTWPTRISRNLVNNTEFRQEFIQRFATHLSITFAPTRVIAIIDEMQDVLEPEMPAHIAKWRDPSGWNGIQFLWFWEDKVEIMRAFANQRPNHIYTHLQNRFPTDTADGTADLTLTTQDPSMGHILVHDVQVPTSPFTGRFFRNLPIRLEAVANPGYRFVEWQQAGVPVSTAAEYVVNINAAASYTAVFALLPRVVINEIHYNPAPSQGAQAAYEFIELYNPGPAAIDLGGYYMDGVVYTFTVGTTIAPDQYIVLAQTAATYTGQGYSVYQWLPSGLNNTGETIRLLTGAGFVVDEVPYQSSAPWPTAPNGNGPSLSLIDDALDNALASSWEPSYILGGTPGGPNAPVVNPIVINEIHYNPADSQGADTDYEFLELYNTGATTLNLAGYTFNNGIAFTFPVGAQIAPGGYVLIAKNAAMYGSAGCPVYQWTSGSLDNAGELVRLVNTANAEMDSVSYDDASPWAIPPDGSGPSLELRNVLFNNALAGSWAPSTAVGGSPCALNSQAPTAVALQNVGATAVSLPNQWLLTLATSLLLLGSWFALHRRPKQNP